MFHRIFNKLCNGMQFIDFPLAPFTLLIFMVCVIIGISQIELFKFFGIERVKQNQKKLKNYSKPHKLIS